MYDGTKARDHRSVRVGVSPIKTKTSKEEK